MSAVAESKLVIIVDEELPAGLVANSCAVLGMTLGKLFPDAIGHDVVDGRGRAHLGIVNIVIPVLKGKKDFLQTLREKLYSSEYEPLTVVDFTETAQRSLHYDDYERAIGEEGAPLPLGVAIHGPKKLVNSLTGSLPLLR